MFQAISMTEMGTRAHGETVLELLPMLAHLTDDELNWKHGFRGSDGNSLALRESE